MSSLSTLLSTLTMSSFLDDHGGCSIIDNGSTYIFNHTNITISTTTLPPSPIAWTYTIIDTICSVLTVCTNWREYFSFLIERNSILSSWLSKDYIIPDLSSYLPTLLTFQQYRQQQGETPSSSADGGTLFDRLSEVSTTWYQYAFHTDSTALGELTTPTALCVVLLLVFPILRLVKSRLLLPFFCKIGYQAAVRAHGVEWIESNPIRITKFGEYAFRLCYHTFITMYGIYYFHDSVWWSSAIEIFRGVPYHSIAPSMAWYYIFQLSYNLDALISLLEVSFTVHLRSVLVRSRHGSSVTWPFPYYLQSPIVIQWSNGVRSDFQEMLIHHIATNLLVIGSSSSRYTRGGSMVQCVHDISDIPVDISKLANFLKWKLTTLACFGVMTITWLYTRLYIFPMKIYYASLTKSHYILEYGVPALTFVLSRQFFCLLMGILILLHIIWFSMFVQMFVRFVVKKEIRDHSEDQKPQPSKTTTTIATVEMKKKV